MIMLSNPAIQYAFMICSEKENYRVGVYCGNKECREQVEGWIDTIHESYINCIGENKAHQRNMRYILFKNGSIIKVLHASDSARGNKFHLCIYDPSINFEAIQMARVSELGDEWYQKMNAKAQNAHQLSDKEKQNVELLK